jgi:hypothetical protein
MNLNLLVCLVTAGVGCAAPAQEDAQSVTQSVEIATPRPTFVAAVRLGSASAPDGYAVIGVNGAWISCGDGRLSPYCFVDGLDLGLDILPAQATVLESFLDGSFQTSVLFEATISADRGGKHTLHTSSIWYAPQPASIDATFTHATNYTGETTPPATAFTVGAINATSAAARSIGTLHLPTQADPAWQQAVTGELSMADGLIVTGHATHDTLSARDVFVRIMPKPQVDKHLGRGRGGFDPTQVPIAISGSFLWSTQLPVAVIGP